MEMGQKPVDQDRTPCYYMYHMSTETSASHELPTIRPGKGTAPDASAYDQVQAAGVAANRRLFEEVKAREKQDAEKLREDIARDPQAHIAIELTDIRLRNPGNKVPSLESLQVSDSSAPEANLDPEEYKKWLQKLKNGEITAANEQE